MEITFASSDKKTKSFLRKNVDGFVLPTLGKDDRILMMKKGEEYVSMIYFSMKPTKMECSVNYIHTNKKHRRRGYSENLIREVLGYCKQEGIGNVCVVILPDSGSDKLFGKLGFSFKGDHCMCLEL